MVTTPQKAAEQVAARVGRMALDARMPLVGMLENMTGGPFGVGSGARLAEKLGTPLLGQVPMDEALSRTGDDGVPLLVSDPVMLSTVRAGTSPLEEAVRAGGPERADRAALAAHRPLAGAAAVSRLTTHQLGTVALVPVLTALPLTLLVFFEGRGRYQHDARIRSRAVPRDERGPAFLTLAMTITAATELAALFHSS